MTASQDEKQIATRYITALFALATEQQKQDAVAEEMAALGKLLLDSSDFVALCQSPVMSGAMKTQAVTAIAKKVKLQPLTTQLLTVLAANQRLDLLGAIAEAFAAKMREYQGEIVAEVATATKLDAKTEKSLATALGNYTGKKVVISVQHNPEILGGLTIRLGGVMIDASTAGKLARLKEKLHRGIKQAA